MYCTNCGVELPVNAQFCVECGTRTEIEVVSVAALPPVPARRRRVKWVAIGTLAVAVAAVGGAYLYANRLAQQKVDEAIAELDGKVGLAYGDVSANPFTRSVTIKDVKVTSIAGKPIDGVAIERLSIKGKLAKDADPQELDARVSKLTLDLSRMGPEWAQLLTMGYGTVVVDSRLDYRYSRKSGEFDLNRLEIASQDLLTVGLSLHLGDLGTDLASPKDALSRQTVTIRGGDLFVKDAVFIERLINSLAEKDGITPAVYKERLTDTVSALLGGGSGKLENDVSAAVVRLINEPRSSLRVTIAPEAPVSLEALKRAGDPDTQLAMLNLQVGS
jgi:hypothetical protein